MNKVYVYSILVILLFFGAVLNFLPHLQYNYPLHVDEYVHWQYANHLSSNTPLYFGGGSMNLEQGFHTLLASMNAIGVPYQFMFNIFPALFTILISLSVFILIRRIFNEKTALFAVLFVALLQTTVSVLGPMFLVPVSLGLFFIAIGLYLIEIKSDLFFLPLAALLIIHPPSALAYFLIINTNLAIKRKNIMKKISLQALAFLIALPLYLPIFFSKGIDSINNLNFTIITGALFIPRFLGYLTILLIAIGIYFAVEKKRFDLIAYSFVFLVFVFLFYRLEVELFLPYKRTLMYLFLVFSTFFGLGCSEIIEKVKKNRKKLKILITVLLVILILIFTLPQKIESTREVYHIISEKDYNAFIFIKGDTPVDSVVLADPWIANALTPIAEREVYSRVTQGPNEFYEAKNREISEFFEGDCTNLELIKQNNISVIYGKCDNPNLDEVYPDVYILS